MKLKYYMRGLGIGILLTTLILTIGNTKEKLSDREIKERAEKLGMVMGEETNDNLDEILADNNVTGTPSIQPSVSPTVGPTVAPTLAITPEPTSEPTKAPAVTELPASEPKPTIGTAADSGQAINSGITFTIESGMSSRKVSALLLQKGLVEDAADFNDYVTQKGKTGTIRVGTFTIPEGASYDDIIKMITN